MIKPHYKISYSQNQEDLILMGIFRNIPNGFYVDVGANHPELDSVTKIFYDKNWSGINVEPNESLYTELVKQRPRDININKGVSSQQGKLIFRSYEMLNGLSTFSQEAKEVLHLFHSDAIYSESQVDVVSLAALFDEYRANGDIHFLKIDVEGMELEVLLGNKWDQYRPWVLCIERSLSISRLGAQDALLAVCNYEKKFFDGVNDYYIAQEKIDIWADFSYPRDVVLDGVPVNYIFIRYIEYLERQRIEK